MSRGVTTLLPYFGGNRTNAKTVGDLLKGCRWVGIPFAGGMPELLHIDAPSIVVSDLHRQVINLARTIQQLHDNETLRTAFLQIVNDSPFHPDTLRRSQKYCQNANLEKHLKFFDDGECCHLTAAHYFIAQWMGRSGNSGTDKEFTGSISVRWNANGGDSNTRFRSAIDGIDAFQSVMRRCNFVCDDCFDFLARCNDTPDVGIYCDPPWPDAGAVYVHHVDDEQFHAKLKKHLMLFTAARVVLRYGDHPLIRELYGNSHFWTVHEAAGRTQGRNKQAELFITNAV